MAKIRVHCIETPTPILLGLDFHQQFGCVADFRHKTCWSYELDRFLAVVTLPSGHLAVDLRPESQD